MSETSGRSERQRSVQVDAVDLFVDGRGESMRRMTPLPLLQQQRQAASSLLRRPYRPLSDLRSGRGGMGYFIDFPRVTYHCVLCNMSCTSEDVFESHVIGQKHLKKLKRKRELESQGAIEKVQQSDLYCKLCNVELTNHDHMAMHMNGRKHKQNARKAGEEVNVELECDLDAFAIPEDKKKDIPPIPAGQTQVFDRYCRHCDKFLSGKSQVLLHIKSHKHKMKVGEEIPSKKKKGRVDEVGRTSGRSLLLNRLGIIRSQTGPLPHYPNPVVNTFIKAIRLFALNKLEQPAQAVNDAAESFNAFDPANSNRESAHGLFEYPPFEAFSADIHPEYFYDQPMVTVLEEEADPYQPDDGEDEDRLRNVEPLCEIPEEEEDEDNSGNGDNYEPANISHQQVHLLNPDSEKSVGFVAASVTSENKYHPESAHKTVDSEHRNEHIYATANNMSSAVDQKNISGKFNKETCIKKVDGGTNVPPVEQLKKTALLSTHIQSETSKRHETYAEKTTSSSTVQAKLTTSTQSMENERESSVSSTVNSRSSERERRSVSSRAKYRPSPNNDREKRSISSSEKQEYSASRGRRKSRSITDISLHPTSRSVEGKMGRSPFSDTKYSTPATTDDNKKQASCSGYNKRAAPRSIDRKRISASDRSKERVTSPVEREKRSISPRSKHRITSPEGIRRRRKRLTSRRSKHQIISHVDSKRRSISASPSSKRKALAKAERRKRSSSACSEHRSTVAERRKGSISPRSKNPVDATPRSVSTTSPLTRRSVSVRSKASASPTLQTRKNPISAHSKQHRIASPIGRGKRSTGGHSKCGPSATPERRFSVEKRRRAPSSGKLHRLSGERGGKRRSISSAKDRSHRPWAENEKRSLSKRESSLSLERGQRRQSFISKTKPRRSTEKSSLPTRNSSSSLESVRERFRKDKSARNVLMTDKRSVSPKSSRNRSRRRPHRHKQSKSPVYSRAEPIKRVKEEKEVDARRLRPHHNHRHDRRSRSIDRQHRARRISDDEDRRHQYDDSRHYPSLPHPSYKRNDHERKRSEMESNRETYRMYVDDPMSMLQARMNLSGRSPEKHRPSPSRDRNQHRQHRYPATSSIKSSRKRY